MNPTKEQYKQALFIVCDLLNGSILYGIDADKLFEIMMEKEGVVSTFVYQDYILNNLDRFSDDDSIRAKAIERLGW